MDIKNKIDSYQQIKRMNLNCLNQEVIYLSNLESVKIFVDQNPCDEYFLRDLDSPMGNCYFAKNYNDILELAKNYKEKFLLCVSNRPIAKNIVLLGDIKVDKERNIIDLFARDDAEATHRNVDDEPDYNLHCSLDDDKIWDVPGFMPLIDYISKNSLYNMIVEFGVYNIPVGNKKEQVLIYEIRKNY